MRGKLCRIPVALALLLLLATGCGKQAQPTVSDRVVKIGLIEALSGRNSEPGQGVRNAVELAIRQANQRNAVSGWHIELAAEDAGDPESAAKAAAKLAADPQVGGVLGTSSSSVSRATIPVLAKADVVQLAYSNTNPTLSLGPFPTQAPKRVWPNFVRLVANDLLQGGFAASYASEQLAFRSVATVNDQKTYGLGLVTAFEDEWRKRRGLVTSSNSVKEGDKDFTPLVDKLLSEKPEFVFYGGEYEEAALLAQQLRARGFRGPFMGGDTLFTKDFIDGAQQGAVGALATSVGQPIEKLNSATTFINEYGRAGFKQSYSAYGGQGYDAANILIAALGRVLPESDGVSAARAQITQTVSRTDGFRGVTGEHSFDEFGDTSNKALTVYKVQGDIWKDVFSGTYEQ
jgi:branched-chain amino acid transport system substrate-binding protein